MNFIFREPNPDLPKANAYKFRNTSCHIISVIEVLILCTCLWCVSLTNGEAENVTKSTYTDTVYPLERNDIALHLDCMKSDTVPVEDNILLVHGLTYSSHEFDVNYKDYSFVRFLCDNGYAVWRIDIAGYGQSERVADGFLVDNRYAAKDVQAAIAKIKEITHADNIDLLGWSWGTVTTALAEEESYKDIDRYVMFAPIITAVGSAQIKEGYHENTWENAASDFQMKSDGIIDDSIVEDAVVNTFCSNCWRYDGSSSPNGGRRELCVDKSTQMIDLSKIKNRTLIICGDKDPYMNMPLVEASLSKLPANSELRIIKGGAHAMLLEQPYYHDFQQAVIAFLKE